MLALLVPDRCDGDESWGHSAFCETQEKSDCRKASKGFRCRKAHADNAPQDYCDSNELGEVELRHQIDEGKLGHKLTDVENGRAP